jgi:hypothetical protein
MHLDLNLSVQSGTTQWNSAQSGSYAVEPRATELSVDKILSLESSRMKSHGSEICESIKSAKHDS